MTRRTWTLAGATVACALGVAGGAVALSGGEQPAAAAGAAEGPAPTTAPVEQGRLSSAVSLTGTLTYRAQPDGTPYAAINRASGIYTRLPEPGDAVRCGAVLYRVDDEPVVVLCGDVPAFRDLESGDEGADVRQLNRNLRRLGLDDDAGVAIPRGEDAFTAQTAAALRELQEAKGGEATGTLDAGDVVVLPRAGRIAKVTARLGGAARPGAQVAQATSRTLEVQVDLEASEQGAVDVGDRARIALPGNRSVNGRVDRLGRVAQTAEDDDAAAATVPASIRLDRPGQARGLDRAPVRVEIVTAGVERALSVPVTALVGRAGGGFAVEVVRAGARRELVPVELGLFDTVDGRVEVDGDLRAGVRVVVPAP